MKRCIYLIAKEKYGAKEGNTKTSYEYMPHKKKTQKGKTEKGAKYATLIKSKIKNPTIFTTNFGFRTLCVCCSRCVRETAATFGHERHKNNR